MIEYLMEYPDKIWMPLLEHIEIIGMTLLLSLVLTSILVILGTCMPILQNILIHLFSIVYSIPSLALFAVLVPVTGLGRETAVIVLVAYNQYLLLRNIFAGFHQVDAGVVEAAIGMGMTKLQRLLQILVPLSKESIFTGIQLAVVSTVGIGTIAACINAGGLGSILFDGLRTMNTVKILWGSLLSAGLAVGVNGLLGLVKGYMTKEKLC